MKAKVVTIRWRFLAGCLKPLPLYLAILPLGVLALFLQLLLLLLQLLVPIHPLGHQSILVRIKETQEETAESIKKGTPWPVAHAHLLHIN